MTNDDSNPFSSGSLDRYLRQTRFPPLGNEGQRRLMTASAFVCGCGALGSTIASHLVRAGVGRVRIVDGDFVERCNLQRQILFDENDADAKVPKVLAAAEKLRKANSSVLVEPIVAKVERENAEELCRGFDILLDGTDNFETRFLLNDVALKHGIPWVFGGCVGAQGQTMTIVPNETPCLRCLLETCPSPDSIPTCHTVGILSPIVGMIASFQAMEAMKILSGNRNAISRVLTTFDLWENRIRPLDLTTIQRRSDCIACQKKQYHWLWGTEKNRSPIPEV